MKKQYICEKCGKGFYDEQECINHEIECGATITFKCNKCGKVIEYNRNDLSTYMLEEQCHHIDLGTPGYGSMLDGCSVKFDLCDNCTYELIESLNNKDEIIYEENWFDN